VSPTLLHRRFRSTANRARESRRRQPGNAGFGDWTNNKTAVQGVLAEPVDLWHLQETTAGFLKDDVDSMVISGSTTRLYRQIWSNSFALGRAVCDRSFSARYDAALRGNFALCWVQLPAFDDDQGKVRLHRVENIVSGKAKDSRQIYTHGVDQ
jgi:hypothetical protein